MEKINCPWISAVKSATIADFMGVEVFGFDNFRSLYIANAPSATFSEDFCIYVIEIY